MLHNKKKSCLEEKHRISHGVFVIREKLAEKVKPAKEAGLVRIAIPTTKRKAGLKIPNMGVKNSKSL